MTKLQISTATTVRSRLMMKTAAASFSPNFAKLTITSLCRYSIYSNKHLSLSVLPTKTLSPFPRYFSDGDGDRDGYEHFSDGLNDVREKILLSTEKTSNHVIPEDLYPVISDISSIILALDDGGDISTVLKSGGGVNLLERSPDGAAFVKLLGEISSRPFLALEAFQWRISQCNDGSHPIKAEEYVKAITLAGRVGKIKLAKNLFDAATSAGLKKTSTYNAMMTVYMHNEMSKQVLSVLDDLKRDDTCEPTIVTYNILLSLFGRTLLVKPMETIVSVIKQSKLCPNIKTYNTLIAGYITAWMWDEMENIYKVMESQSVEPDVNTHLLMLRGFANSGNLEKMERTYELVKDHVNAQSPPILLMSMLCAYCKRTHHPNRVNKIEEILMHIPKEAYRAWLNVMLIKLYAEEGLMEKMDGMIFEAMNRKTVIITKRTLNLIITNYFHSDDVDRLNKFIKMAELEGWKLYRSSYHCKMVMSGRHHRFREMHDVLKEMDAFNIAPCKKTYGIMYAIFTDYDRKTEADTVYGLLWKRGFQLYRSG